MDKSLDTNPAASVSPMRDGVEQSLMYAEAAAAPGLSAEQLERNASTLQSLAADLRKTPPRYVLTCGRGSSSNAATYARYLLGGELGQVVAPVPPAIASVYQSRRNMDGALFIAISQSGQSPDILENARSAKEGGAHVLALVNHEDSPLAELADAVIPMQAGERSGYKNLSGLTFGFAAARSLLEERQLDDPGPEEPARCDERSLGRRLELTAARTS